VSNQFASICVGTMLPLWKFCPSVAYGKTVTAICWNTRYPHTIF
jgi:hypothetical protein